MSRSPTVRKPESTASIGFDPCGHQKDFRAAGFSALTGRGCMTRHNVFANEFNGKGLFDLQSGSASITSDISTFGGSFKLGNNTGLTVTSDAEKLSLNVEGTKMSAFTFNGTGETAAQLAFTNASFAGTANFTKADISGSEYAAGNSTLVLNQGASYTADTTGLKLGGLTANDGSKLVFTSSALPGTSATANVLSVSGNIALNATSTVDVAGGIIGNLTQEAGQGNLLEQDDNLSHAITLATAGNVTGTANAQLTVDGKKVESELQTFAIGEDAVGTYGYKLSGADNKLSVTYGLTKLSVNAGKTVTLGQKGNGDATLDAQVTGQGGLTIDTAKEVVLANKDNDYTGATNVNEGNLKAEAGALGQTSSLNVAKESTVTLNGAQSGIQALNVAGTLAVANGALTVNGSNNSVAKLTVAEAGSLTGSGSLTLTGEGSEIKGANEGFSGDVSLDAGSTTVIDNAQGLGSGAVALEGNLTAQGASGTFANVLTGSGTFALTQASSLTLTNGTGFAGTFDLGTDEGSKLTLESESGFELASTVTGNGDLKVAANGGVFTIGNAGQLQDFSGVLTLSNAVFTVNEMVAGKNLTAVDASQLTISGAQKLGNFSVNGAKLDFTGATAPGTDGLADSRLEVDTLRKDGVNQIVVDKSLLVNANPGDAAGKLGLTAQDVIAESKSTDITTVLISAANGVTGEGTFQLVDKDGNEIRTNADQTFGISNAAGTEEVAKGTYGYGVSTAGSNVGIAWQLKEVSILDGKTLVLSTQEGEDSTLSAKLSGNGGFTAQSGSVTLAAENSYTGITTVNQGAEIVVTNDKSLGNTTGLRNSGTVSMADRNVTVAGATENSGTINIGMGTLTTDAYTGVKGSVLAIGANVTADKTENGKLVVTGAATGTSRVDLTFTDTSVGRAVTGIDIAQLGAGSDLTLELNESIKVGDYYYRLMKTEDGSRYYVVGSLTDGGTTAMTTSQLMTPENGSRAALAFMNQRAFDFGLNSHIGEKTYVDPVTGQVKKTSLWLVQTGTWDKMDDASGQLKNDGHMFTTNLGGDVYAWNTGRGRVSVGLMGGWADGSYDVDSNVTGLKADADFDGWSLGAYAAWQHAGESGLFANAQIRWNDFTNEVKGQGLEKEKYDASGISLGVEAGWNQRLWTAAAANGSRSKAWDVTPFVRVTWSDVSADDHTDAYGQRFTVEGDGNVAFTLGARTSFELGSKGQTPRFADPIVRVFAEGAWVHNTQTFESKVVNANGSSTAEFGIDNYGQFRVGVEGEFTKNFQLWGDVNYEAGTDSYSSTGFTLGAKYVF